MDLSTIAFAMGSAWLSGINLYATVATLGLLQRFHLVTMPGDLGYLGHSWVIGVAGALYAIQFVADKIPAVDSVWDVVHTFIRIPAGAILAATAFAHFDPSVRLVALLAGGSIALSSHSAKAATRLAANTSPEPFSNIGLSLLEDALTIGSAVLMSIHPAVMLVIVIVALLLSILLFRWLYRAFQRLFKRGPRQVPAAQFSK